MLFRVKGDAVNYVGQQELSQAKWETDQPNSGLESLNSEKEDTYQKGLLWLTGLKFKMA